MLDDGDKLFSNDMLIDLETSKTRKIYNDLQCSGVLIIGPAIH